MTSESKPETPMTIDPKPDNGLAATPSAVPDEGELVKRTYEASKEIAIENGFGAGSLLRMIEHILAIARPAIEAPLLAEIERLRERVSKLATNNQLMQEVMDDWETLIVKMEAQITTLTQQVEQMRENNVLCVNQLTTTKQEICRWKAKNNGRMPQLMVDMVLDDINGVVQTLAAREEQLTKKENK